jgi:hypothetical protein
MDEISFQNEQDEQTITVVIAVVGTKKEYVVNNANGAADALVEKTHMLAEKSFVKYADIRGLSGGILKFRDRHIISYRGNLRYVLNFTPFLSHD